MDRRSFIARVVGALAAIPVLGRKKAGAVVPLSGVPAMSQRARNAYAMLGAAPGMVAVSLIRECRPKNTIRVWLQASWKGPLGIDSVDGLMRDVAGDVPHGFRLDSLVQEEPLYLAEGYAPPPTSPRATCCFGRQPHLPCDVMASQAETSRRYCARLVLKGDV